MGLLELLLVLLLVALIAQLFTGFLGLDRRIVGVVVAIVLIIFLFRVLGVRL